MLCDRKVDDSCLLSFCLQAEKKKWKLMVLLRVFLETLLRPINSQKQINVLILGTFPFYNLQFTYMGIIIGFGFVVSRFGMFKT